MLLQNLVISQVRIYIYIYCFVIIIFFAGLLMIVFVLFKFLGSLFKGGKGSKSGASKQAELPLELRIENGLSSVYFMFCDCFLY